MTDSRYRQLALATLLLCLIVVVLGAYVRLSDAGLGCPDWPGCYGQLIVPTDSASANAAYPERPLEPAKAWKEMIHRYAASGVGLGIMLLMIFGWNRPGFSRAGLAGLFGLVCFQGVLGMWTVTWQLKPLAVTAHLLGGMATLGLLAALNAHLWRDRGAAPAGVSRRLRLAGLAGLLLLFGQIFLGGWTSSNYAALACPDLPTCHAQWWPESDFSEGFVIWRGLGQNYEYGVLDSPARTAIHLSHRLGAIVLSAFLLWLAWLLWREAAWQRWGGALLAALLLQLSLGISSVLFGLPLLVAAGHNAGAALLVMLLAVLNVRLAAAPARREVPG